jgi:lipopolysaccharide/colanic/teichoic acid biosynthesis glycosyltransferase
MSTAVEDASFEDQVTPINVIQFNQRYLWGKRALDILFTLLILVPLCLLIVIVGIAIRLDSEGPIFFRQQRLGQQGKEFTMLKFRSMHVRQDDSLHREAIKRYIAGQALHIDANGEASYKLADDPRITRIGRFLRKTSIDELPQFLNVLRGDMSLVGPRPPVRYEVEHYQPADWLRLAGKPGLTGPWQVYGRSAVTFQEMVKMDIRYLQRQSIWGDIKLIIMTIPVMLSGHGAA